jgi:hypothetical protein
MSQTRRLAANLGAAAAFFATFSTISEGFREVFGGVLGGFRHRPKAAQSLAPAG